MKDSKLIKSFTKASWLWAYDSIQAIAIFMFLMLMLNLDIEIPHLISILLFIGFLLFIFIKVLSETSTLRVYQNYIICHKLLHFWKTRRLFYFDKIKKISIQRGEQLLSSFKIYYENGNTYEYSIGAHQIDDFVLTLNQSKIDVKVIIF